MRRRLYSKRKVKEYDLTVVIMLQHNIALERFLEIFHSFKAAYSVTMNIFRKFLFFLFKSFAKVELSYVFTIKMLSTAENCMKK